VSARVVKQLAQKLKVTSTHGPLDRPEAKDGIQEAGAQRALPPAREAARKPEPGRFFSAIRSMTRPKPC